MFLGAIVASQPFVNFTSMDTAFQVVASITSVSRDFTPELDDALQSRLRSLAGLRSVTALEPNQLVLRIADRHLWRTVMPEIVSAYQATIPGIACYIHPGLEPWFDIQDLFESMVTAGPRIEKPRANPPGV